MSDLKSSNSKPFARRIITTNDGSSSIMIDELNETYHSHKGALTESVFVFIEHGLKKVQKHTISILEIGMGTGLNVLLSIIHGVEKKINFHTLEPYPLIKEEWESLNYSSMLSSDPMILNNIHNVDWNKKILISPNFYLTKHPDLLENFIPTQSFDLVYFDAFAPSKQFSPWQKSNLEKIFKCMNKGGILITYCAQGQFKRDLKSVGFQVICPPGPMGKREITMAIKP